MTIHPATITVATTLVLVALCVASDVHSLRIPNAITGPAVAAGVGLNAWHFGWVGAEASLAGCVIATLLLFAPFALGGIGAGDVKMMSAVGALLGPQLVLRSLVVGLILGGVITAVHLARRARLREKLVATGRMLVNALLATSLEPLKLSATSSNAVALPYSVPLGLGTVGVIALSLLRNSR